MSMEVGMESVSMWRRPIEALSSDGVKELHHLQAENAKLFALLKHESEQTEKLRELVRDMWEFGFGDNSGANNAWAWHERTDELEGRMRELGVEASDG